MKTITIIKIKLLETFTKKVKWVRGFKCFWTGVVFNFVNFLILVSSSMNWKQNLTYSKS